MLNLGYLRYNDLMKATSFHAADVKKIASLAHIPVNDEEAAELAEGFTKTLGVVDQLSNIDVTGIVPTSQVTGLENVFRDDEVDPTRMLSQEEALKNAKRTHNGYFVVDQILDE